MRLRWIDLGTPRADQADQQQVEIEGFLTTMLPIAEATYFVLVAEPPCCPGCASRDPLAAIEVHAAAPIKPDGQKLRLTGTWQVSRAAIDGWRYRLSDAQPLDPPGWRGISRRGVLVAGPLMCLAASPSVKAQDAVPQRAAEARQAIKAAPTVDIHSHAGGIASVTRVRNGGSFGDVAGPMREGGMAAVCLAVVSDGPTHKVMPDGRIHPYRDPEPGELYNYAQLAFARVTDMARLQGLAVIADGASLRAARSGTASAIISAEGADFLEGRIERVDEAYARWWLRHLQLTHYRVNELGDIQTEAPVHGGLTDFGAEVIRRSNRLGLVVDVAHGTYDLVKRAASVTTKPLVLSHTSLAANPAARSRRISPDHARIIAETGGVIGIWPPAAEFATMNALAIGVARMVSVAGIDHVGLGSDMRGLVGPSVFPDYDKLPELAEALLGVGFNASEVSKLLGGNYARVFSASVT